MIGCVMMIICLIFVQGSTALTPELRTYFLKRHNDYRSALALGTIKNKLNSTNLPTASNIYELRYSLDVEKIAQTSADSCVMEHKVIDNTTNNLFGEQNFQQFDEIARVATAAWIDEINKTGLSTLNFTRQVYEHEGVGHWFEVNWHDVKEIGCGIKHCNGLKPQAPSEKVTFVVCAYHPGGNYLNELVYTPGPPCSNCNSYPNSKCNKKTGLCHIDEPHTTHTPIKTASTESITSSATPLSESTEFVSLTTLLTSTLLIVTTFRDSQPI